MGAKTALVAFADGDIRAALRGVTGSDRAAAEALVRRVHPNRGIEPAPDGTLDEFTRPPVGLTYAAALPGVDIVCDQRFTFARPSELPEHLLELGRGRRIVVHSMHSVVDWLAFAVWEDGVLVRSLSLSPEYGIEENVGEPYDFERPYWAGGHPVEPDPDWEDEEPYPLPFHPLDLGEEALRAFFGFILEGYPDPEDVDADRVLLHGFRVTGPA
ncbi:hypothetical protein AB0H12_00740 [Actinosynnema sp. NPDC023794]